MQIFCIYKGFKGFRKVYNYAKKIQNVIQPVAFKRVEIIEFFEEFGLEPTIKAFKISKSTIYRWRKLFKENQNRVEVLNNKSRAPKRKRESKVNFKIIQFIRKIREEYPRLGKEKIKPLLDEYCEKENLSKISESTIGRIIKRYNLNYYKSYRKKAKLKIKKNRLPKGYKVKDIGEIVEIDGITEYFEKGIKRYILTAIDRRSKFAFSYCFKNLSSKSSEEFMNKLKEVAPFKIKGVKTDNGKEFLKYFDKYLEKEGITHYFTYPYHPQQQGCVERFNRTLQEEWLWKIELSKPTEEINKSLMEYLIFYNTKRVHKSLNNKIPLDFIVQNSKLSNMLWTYTFS